MGDLSLLSERKLRGEYGFARQKYVTPPWMKALALIIKNGPDRIKLPWLGGVSSGMRERDGSGSTSKVQARYIDLDVVEYEDGTEIPLKDMRRDEVGFLSRQLLLGELAMSDEEHWEELTMDLIDGAAATNCYDGQFFFDTDHADSDGSYSTNQSNKIDVDISAFPSVKSGSPTKPSAEDIVWAFAECIRTIVTFRNNQGKYINRMAKQFIGFVPMTLWAAALGASGSELHGYGATNLLRTFLKNEAFDLDIHPSPFLSWTDRVAVFRANYPRPPIVGLEEKLEPEVRHKIYQPSNSESAKKGEYIRLEIRANRIMKLGDWRSGCQGILI